MCRPFLLLPDGCISGWTIISSRLCLLTRNLCLSSNAKQLLPRSGCAKVLQSRGYCQGALQTNSANQALDCTAACWKVNWSSQATIPKKLCKRDSSKKHAAKQYLTRRCLQDFFPKLPISMQFQQRVPAIPPSTRRVRF